jgi:predicted N-formylglutamate amidohydrolase
VVSHDGGMLLSHDEPAPSQVQGRSGQSSFFIICDHAGQRLPRALGSLGLSESQLASHVAWDIGALGVAQKLGVALDACVVWQRYSRLVIDCNRPPGAVDSIVRRSERTDVPGNHELTPSAVEARAREIFQPYHDEIERALDQRQAEGRPTLLVSVHSFTPAYLDVARRWHAGVLYGPDARLARPVLQALRAEAELVVGDNEPYAVGALTDFSVNYHGEAREIPYVELEIRQDLIADDAGQQAWAERLARVLTFVVQQSGPNQANPPSQPCSHHRNTHADLRWL